MENKRCSYGAGLVFLLGVARIEVNYCVPVGAQSKDRYAVIFQKHVVEYAFTYKVFPMAKVEGMKVW